MDICYPIGYTNAIQMQYKTLGSQAYLNWSHQSEIWGAQSSNNLGNAHDMVLHYLSGGQYIISTIKHFYTIKNTQVSMHLPHQEYYCLFAYLTLFRDVTCHYCMKPEAPSGA